MKDFHRNNGCQNESLITSNKILYCYDENESDSSYCSESDDSNDITENIVFEKVKENSNIRIYQNNIIFVDEKIIIDITISAIKNCLLISAYLVNNFYKFKFCYNYQTEYKNYFYKYYNIFNINDYKFNIKDWIFHCARNGNVSIEKNLKPYNIYFCSYSILFYVWDEKNMEDFFLRKTYLYDL